MISQRQEGGGLPGQVARATRVSSHLREHTGAVRQLLGFEARIERWGAFLRSGLRAGGRLLVAGNGGSAAEAEHLVAELVGRFVTDREPLPAIALPAGLPSLTAIANDYGWREAYARAVLGQGRRSDVLLTLSASGRSANLVRAAEAARSIGMHTWALTGAPPNPLEQVSDETIPIAGTMPAVQESHLVAVHLLCACIDEP